MRQKEDLYKKKPKHKKMDPYNKSTSRKREKERFKSKDYAEE